MSTLEQEKFSALIDDVAHEIVATEHLGGGSFIRTPILYPSGSTVVVRIERGAEKYLVSDWGGGHQEADMIGAGHLFSRFARPVADEAGIRFDNQAFFILEATRDQLPGAVITIANCSQGAAIRVSDALAEKTFEDSKERLYQRLVSVFNRKIVVKNAEIIGSSATPWRVATLVKNPGAGRAAIFEPVTKNHSSVAHATMKFHDIALLEDAPTRIAVVSKKNEFGTYLTVLSQSAKVVDEDISDETIKRLSLAA